jgi:hypothetical protein
VHILDADVAGDIDTVDHRFKDADGVFGRGEDVVRLYERVRLGDSYPHLERVNRTAESRAGYPHTGDVGKMRNTASCP